MVVKNILVALDFSSTSKEALDFARTLADACGASLHLLHVVGCRLAASNAIEQERRDACAKLDALLDREDRVRRRATVSCQVGTPAHEIAGYAADHAIDLIVVGTHSHDPTLSMAIGSIADAVIGLAPCAVLVVKGDEAERRSRRELRDSERHAGSGLSQ